MPFEDLPHYNPLHVLSGGLTAVNMVDQPPLPDEIPVNEDIGELNPFLPAAALEADANDCAAAVAGQQVQEAGPDHEPGSPGNEWLDILLVRLRHQGEGRPALGASPEGLSPNAFISPADLQASRFAPT